MARPPLAPDVVDTRAMLEAAARPWGHRGLRRAGSANHVRASGSAGPVAWQRSSPSCGVGKGDVVALWLPSGIDYATCYAAAAMIGAITTGLNPRLGRREIESILQQADPALVVADERLGAIPDTGHRLLSTQMRCAVTRRGRRPPSVQLTRRDLVALIFTERNDRNAEGRGVRCRPTGGGRGMRQA